SYGRRRLGEDALFRHFPAAVTLHGKLFLDEADDRTYLAPEGWPARYAPDFKASVQMLRRQFANAISRGVGLYYMDQSGTFFADPLLIAELGRLKRWGDYSMTLPRTSVAQVAVVSSLQSEFYTAGRETGRIHIGQALYDAQMAELCRSGAPFDWIHIDDLAEERLRPYRVYIFLDAFYLTPLQQAAIERLKTDGRTLLWFYAPGFVGEDGLSLDRMQAVTGMQFEQQPEGALQVTLDRNAFPHAPAAFGFPISQSPVFVPTDADLRIWGRTATGTPAFVARDAADWRSVYCLTPAIPSAVLRQVFRDAGVHIYCDSDDPFSANASWVCLHTATAGRKTIRLPASAPVFDTVDEKLVVASDTEFAVDLDAGETGIWVLARPGP
ncbi:MAG: hypothetical protein JXA69_08905, partial [Phycisphaerae bacterium]|nr:hypothetical protein [Phycisphaerae bacterium]